MVASLWLFLHWTLYTKEVQCKDRYMDDSRGSLNSNYAIATVGRVVIINK